MGSVTKESERKNKRGQDTRQQNFSFVGRLLPCLCISTSSSFLLSSTASQLGSHHHHLITTAHEQHNKFIGFHQLTRLHFLERKVMKVFLGKLVVSWCKKRRFPFALYSKNAFSFIKPLPNKKISVRFLKNKDNQEFIDDHHRNDFHCHFDETTNSHAYIYYV